MNRLKHIAFALVAIFYTAQTPAFAQTSDENSQVDIIIYMNKFPPFANLLPDGSMKGEWVDKASHFIEQAGLTYEIQNVPWERAYEEALNKENVLIANLDRTENREDLFHWLMPITSISYSLLAANRPEYKNATLSQILDGEEEVGCVKASAPCQMLKDIGFPENRIVEFPDFAGLVITNLVLERRVAFILEDYSLISKRISNLEMSSETIIPLFDVKTITSYLAASKNIDPDILKQLPISTNAGEAVE